MLIRGTTPIIEVDIDFNPQEIVTFYITFEQNDVVVLEKKLEDCEITKEKIVCKLSQEDTLKFDSTNKNNGSKHWLNIQVRTRLIDGTAISQDIKKVDVGRILKDGVI